MPEWGGAGCGAGRPAQGEGQEASGVLTDRGGGRGRELGRRGGRAGGRALEGRASEPMLT